MELNEEKLHEFLFKMVVGFGGVIF